MFDKIKEDVRELLTGSNVENDMRARLHADHDEVARLMSELLATRDHEIAMRDDLRDQLILALTVHLRAEEDVVYNALSQRPATAGLTLHSFREHDDIERVMGELRVFDAGDPGFRVCVSRLRDSVTTHVHDEENEFLPQAERELGKDHLASLIPMYNARKVEITQELATHSLGSNPSVPPGWDALSESHTQS